MTPTAYLRFVEREEWLGGHTTWRVLQQWWSESSEVKYQSPAYRDSFGSAEGEWRDVKIEREDA